MRRSRTLSDDDRKRELRSTNRALDAVRETIPDQRISVGHTSLYPTGVQPDQWLVAQGADVGRQAYPELFEAIGETFGAGDGSTTFTLPDLSASEPANYDYLIFAGR